MPQVNYEQTSNVTGRVAVTLTKEELNDRIKTELKQQRPKVNMRGFRKGKVPLSTLRKMMGNQVLAQSMDEMLNDSITNYIKENDLKIVMAPQPVEDANMPTITANSLQDITLEYDLALRPDYEIVYPEGPFTKYVIELDEADIDETIDNIRRQIGGSQTVTEGEVQEDDMINVTITEVGPLEDKITADGQFYASSLAEGGKELFMGKAIGSAFELDDLSVLEDNANEEFVRKYILKLEEEEGEETDLTGKRWSIAIDSVGRITPAEMDEDFFAKYDSDGEITTEEQLREAVRADHAEQFNAQGQSMLEVAAQEAFMEANKPELPLDMIRKIHNSDEGDFEGFQGAFTWMTLRDMIVEQEDLQLSYDDLRDEALDKLLGMLGGRRPPFLDDAFVDNYTQKMMEDESQRMELTHGALNRLVREHIADTVPSEEKTVGKEAFIEAIQAFNEKHAPAEEEE